MVRFELKDLIRRQMTNDKLNRESRLSLWVGVGVALGAALGVVWGNIGFGVAIGIVVGAALGFLVPKFRN